MNPCLPAAINSNNSFFKKPEQPLVFYQQIDAGSIQSWCSDVNWAVSSWFYNHDNLMYEIKIAGKRQQWFCHLIMTRHSWQEQPSFDVIDFLPSNNLYHGNIKKLKSIILDWITYGWNRRSTLLRILKWTSVCLKALEAEAALKTYSLKVAPKNLMVIHNTKMVNADSICREGLSLKYSKSGHGIWARPPSFGLIDSTFFTGDLSFLIDVSDMKINNADNWAIVIGDDIPIGRIVRVFDLQKKKDG